MWTTASLHMYCDVKMKLKLTTCTILYMYRTLFPPLSCRPDRGADKRMDFSSDWEGQNSPPRNTAGVSSLPVWLCNHSSSQSMRLVLHAKWWCYIVRVWCYTWERSGTLVSQETICIGNSLHIPRSFHSIFRFHSPIIIESIIPRRLFARRSAIQHQPLLGQGHLCWVHLIKQ